MKYIAHGTLSKKMRTEQNSDKIIVRNIIQAQYQQPTGKIIASDKIMPKTRSKAQNYCYECGSWHTQQENAH